jgi:hypothetical protein
LRSGDAELRAVNREGLLLGIEHLPASDQPLIGVKIHIKVRKPDMVSVARALAAPEIISSGARRELAEQVAKLYGVETRQAKAPRTVLKAIADLNEMSMLAMSLRAGRRDAAALMRHLLKDIPIDRLGGLAGDAIPAAEGGFAAMTAKVESISESLFPVRGCLTTMPQALEVMQAAFALDFADKNKEPEWTKRAGVYVRQRLQTVERFAGTVRRTVARGGGRLPAGPEEPMDLIIPPGESEFPPGEGIDHVPGRTGIPGPDPGPEPEPIPGFDGPDLCDMVQDLCIALFEEVTAATLRDEYVDLIGSVEPNCLCSNYDPNQVFVARPAANRAFPDPLPRGVQLHFGNRIITPISVAPDEIRFRIPPNFQSGPVYLRMLGLTPSQASRRLASACGKIIPDLPHEMLLDRAPAAFLSIIYPPVVEALTANRQSGEVVAEACRPVEICWQTHLCDQSAGDLIWPCGSIRLTIFEEIVGGQAKEVLVVDTTSLSGCMSMTAPEDRIYRAVARSYADQRECGMSASTDLLVRRVPHLRLSVPPNGTNEVLGGSNGRFVVEISCPAPLGGIAIQLTSADPQVLQVPANVTVPEGSTKAEVEFTTLAGMCRTVQLMASADGFAFDRPLDIIVYRKPDLRWVGPAPTVSLCQDFSLEVFADCLPDDLSRVEWVMVSQRDGQGFAEFVDLQATRASTPNHYVLTIPQAERANFTRSGTWELRVQVRNRSVVSDPIPLEVVGGTVSGALSSPSPFFDVCQSTTAVRIEWNVSAVQAIRLVLDGNTLHEEGSPSSPLTTQCGSTSGGQWVNVPTNGADLGSQKQLMLEGLTFEGAWQGLATLSLVGRVDLRRNPVESCTILNFRNEKLFVYTVSPIGTLLDRVEAPAGGNTPTPTEVPLRDCLTLTVLVFTENPPSTWPPAGHREPPPWNPGDAQWVTQWSNWRQAITPAVTKVMGAGVHLIDVH